MIAEAGSMFAGAGSMIFEVAKFEGITEAKRA